MTKLDDRSAAYLSEPQAESLPLTDMERLCLTSRISYLEGQMSAALDAIRELRQKLEAREGDHR